ncbi:tetratricopeptide repeat protein [Algiphilus sp.]|uniref:tetratricopeptide repeat protein n=1 Tax=Algiphilus sp. TaxID=1872431 RepID=UPI003B519BB0
MHTIHRNGWRCLLAAGCLWVGVAHAGVDTQAYSAYAAYKSGNYEEARRLWSAAAERGSTDAMINLANLYVQGQGVARDLVAAAAWYRRAAEAGDPVAQVHLGEAYEAGSGVARDNQAAARWFREAAAQGDAQGAFNLGVMLATDFGAGLEHSSHAQRVAALEWLAQAAEAGHREARTLHRSLQSLMDADSR